MRWLWRYSRVGYFGLATVLVALIYFESVAPHGFDLRDPTLNPVRNHLGADDVLSLRRDGRSAGVACVLANTGTMGSLYPDGERVLVVRGVVYAERELRPENHHPTLSRQEFNWLWARCAPDPRE